MTHTTLSANPDAILEGLNPHQRAAVTYPFDSHCLVLAGAGCGKTTVLIRRIAQCALEYCPQDRILALTFTRKAAEEMDRRLLSVPGIRPDLPQPLVTTFHGYGLRILRESVGGVRNYTRLGYTDEPVLLDERGRLAMLAECSTPEERRSMGVTITALVDCIARYFVNPQRNRGLAEPSLKLLECIAVRFTELKKAGNFWEFHDMIAEALNLFARFPAIAAHYGDGAAAILIDEFQDTNPLQIALLKKVMTPHNRVFAVGDDDQAIYAFRGADIGPILGFREYFPGASILKLEINYRSTPAILAAANRIFSDKPAQFRKVLCAGRYTAPRNDRGVRPEKRLFRDLETMVDFIHTALLRLEKEAAIPATVCAILFRLNESLEALENVFRARFGVEKAFPKFMTIHGAKGLEFPAVFLCDLEEGIFPHYPLKRVRRIRSWADVLRAVLKPRARSESGCDFEEERRLFYVGVTRAERFLFLLSLKAKKIHGRITYCTPSRFRKLF
jgi:superfamily I DNA/RNA helicase